MKNQNPKLETTNEYDKFVSHEHQQPMSQAHVQKLAKSMAKHGFLPSRPIQVYWSTKLKKFVVIDGHHRLRAAEIAGVAVYYVVEDASHKDLIGDTNVLVRKWSNESFVKMYAGQGFQDYKTLLYYTNRGLPLNIVASLLRMESAHSGNAGRLIREGIFKVKDNTNIEIILSLLDSVKESAQNITKRPYVEAISMCLYVEPFDILTLKKRILANPTMVQSCAKRHQALDVLEDIYNYRASTKLNLKFLAEEAMRVRQQIWNRRSKAL